MTGRAAILVLVLAVLTVSYASSFRAYLQQRSELAAQREAIDSSRASIASLTTERQRWADPAYIAAQARLRLGYVMPGETSYVVLDTDGKPLAGDATLSDPSQVTPKAPPTAWWDTAWQSVEVAGNPPKQSQQAPLIKIEGSPDDTGSSAKTGGSAG